MENKIVNQTNSYVKEHGRKLFWHRIWTVLACVVVFVTTYVLIMPAVTQQAQTYCGQQEHVHDENCYTLVDTLICGLEESEQHTHDENCYQQESVLTCDIPVHEHTLQCFSNPEADLEDKNTILNSIKNVELTGNYREDLLNIAKSQLGYKESEANYNVLQDGTTIKGYSRYGSFVDDPYIDWNSAFVSFCLNYAKIDFIPFELDINKCYEKISTDENLYFAKGEYDPQAGDLIFFDKDKDGKCDTVGIVSEVNDNTVITIEGDLNNTVAYGNYSLDDDAVLGYAKTDEIKEVEEENMPVARPMLMAPLMAPAPNGTETTKVEVEKVWVGDSESDRPNSITFTLKQNGSDYDTGIANASNGWKYTFDNLPYKDSNGNLYSYTVAEQTVDGYVSSVGSTQTVSGIYWGEISGSSVLNDGTEEYLIVGGNDNNRAISTNQNSTTVTVTNSSRVDSNGNTYNSYITTANASNATSWELHYSDGSTQSSNYLKATSGSYYLKKDGKTDTSTGKDTVLQSYSDGKIKISGNYIVLNANGSLAGNNKIANATTFKFYKKVYGTDTYKVTVTNTSQKVAIINAINSGLDLAHHNVYYRVSGAYSSNPSVNVVDLSLGGTNYNRFYFKNVFEELGLSYVEVGKNHPDNTANAETFTNYLVSEYQKAGSGDAGLQAVKDIWDRYIYDMYDPTFDYGKLKLDNGGGTYYPFYTYGDQYMVWPKDDKSSSFNNQDITGTINSLDYSLSNGGIDYDKIFVDNQGNSKNPLDKSVTAVAAGDSNVNRKYNVDLSTKIDAKGKAPVALIFEIQTSWQMFDLLHANATTTDGLSAANMKVGAASYNTELCNLFAIKKAMIMFANYMENEYSGNNLFIAVSEFQHGGGSSLFQKGGYLSNDYSEIIEGLYNWNTFGNCEHNHYNDGNILDDICDNLETELAQLKDKDNVTVKYDDVRKAVVLIGGPTENNANENGYALTLPWSSFRDNDLDSVYAIRANEGTPVSANKAGIISWIDYSGNVGPGKVPFNNGTGNTYTEEYIATTAQEMYETLVEIAEREIAIGGANLGGINASADDVVITDTIQDEFVLDESSSITATIYNSNGSVYRSYSVTNPDSDVRFTKTVNADGTTTVSYNFGTLQNGQSVKLHFGIKAKDDFIGSNNVFSNVSTPDLSYKAKGSSYTGSSDDTPEVNVPIIYGIENGGRTTVTVNTPVDLASLDVDNIYSEIHDLVDNYDQINGTITYSWILPDGTETNALFTTDVSSGNVGTLPSADDLAYNWTPNSVGNYTAKLKITFTPDTVVDNGNFSNNNTAQPVNPKNLTGNVYITANNNDDNNDVSLFHVQKVFSDGNPDGINSVSFVLQADNGKYLVSSSSGYAFVDQIDYAEKYVLSDNNGWEKLFRDLPNKIGITKINSYTAIEYPEIAGYVTSYNSTSVVRDAYKGQLSVTFKPVGGKVDSTYKYLHIEFTYGGESYKETLPITINETVYNGGSGTFGIDTDFFTLPLDGVAPIGSGIIVVDNANTYLFERIDASGNHINRCCSGYGQSLTITAQCKSIAMPTLVPSTKITNTPKEYDINALVTKVDKDDHSILLFDAVFELYMEADEDDIRSVCISSTKDLWGIKSSGSLITGNDGTTQSFGLYYDTVYYLVETRAPSAVNNKMYKANEKPVAFKVENINGSDVLTILTGTDFTENAYVGSAVNGVLNITVENAEKLHPSTDDPPTIDRVDIPDNNKITISKKIDYLGDNPGAVGMDDMYRLNLELESKADPIDLLLILDQSNSMEFEIDTKTKAPAGVKSRQISLLEFLNGTATYNSSTDDWSYSGNGFIKDFLNSVTGNDLAVLTFASSSGLSNDYYIRHWGNTADTLQNQYGQTTSDLKKPTVDGGGTNYSAAIEYADDILAEKEGDGKRKLVIFLGDGAVTYANFNGTTYGDGQDTTSYISSSTIESQIATYLDHAKAVADGGNYTSLWDAYCHNLSTGNLITLDSWYSVKAISPNAEIDLGGFPKFIEFGTLEIDLSDFGITGNNLMDAEITDSTKFNEKYDHYRENGDGNIDRWYYENHSEAIEFYNYVDSHITYIGDCYDLFNITKNAFYDFYQEINSGDDKVSFYSIGYSGDTVSTYPNGRTASEVLKYFSGNDNFYPCTSAKALADAIRKIVSVNTIQINDTVSNYVNIPENAGMKISIWDGDANSDPVVLYDDSLSPALRPGASDILDTTNPFISDNRLSVKVKTNENTEFMDYFKILVEFNVETNVNAYDEYIISGYGAKGDPDTDVDGNDTSSGKDGFYSNGDASASWFKGTDKNVEYAKPVIQVHPVELTVLKQVSGPSTGETFNFTADISGKKFPIPATGANYSVNDDRNQASFALSANQSVTIVVPKNSNLTITEIPADGYTQIFKQENVTLTNDNSCNLKVKDDVDLTIINVPGYELPKTGGIGNTIFYLGGSAMVMSSLLMLLKKKKHNYSN